MPANETTPYYTIYTREAQSEKVIPVTTDMPYMSVLRIMATKDKRSAYIALALDTLDSMQDMSPLTHGHAYTRKQILANILLDKAEELQ